MPPAIEWDVRCRALGETSLYDRNPVKFQYIETFRAGSSAFSVELYMRTGKKA
jgi:hypothetical protein